MRWVCTRRYCAAGSCRPGAGGRQQQQACRTALLLLAVLMMIRNDQHDGGSTGAGNLKVRIPLGPPVGIRWESGRPWWDGDRNPVGQPASYPGPAPIGRACCQHADTDVVMIRWERFSIAGGLEQRRAHDEER